MTEVYAQVLITCTTINVLIFLTYLVIGIATKVYDHRRKKKEKKWTSK